MVATGYEPVVIVVTPEMIAEQAIVDTFHKLRLIPKPIRVEDAIWKAAA